MGVELFIEGGRSDILDFRWGLLDICFGNVRMGLEIIRVDGNEE
jgi:hypothetical protein